MYKRTNGNGNHAHQIHFSSLQVQSLGLPAAPLAPSWRRLGHWNIRSCGVILPRVVVAVVLVVKRTLFFLRGLKLVIFLPHFPFLLYRATVP